MKNKRFLIIALIIISLLAGCTNGTNPDTNNGTENNTGTGTENNTGTGTENNTGTGTENNTGNNNTGSAGDNMNKNDPVVSKEIPTDFPEDIVPLYDVVDVEGVITVGSDYYQAYYYSDTEGSKLVERYKEFYKDKEVQVFENGSSYEVSGTVDGQKVRMYIMPYNQDPTGMNSDTNTGTGTGTTGNGTTGTGNGTTGTGTTGTGTGSDTTGTSNTNNKTYKTTVIVFVYGNNNTNAQ